MTSSEVLQLGKGHLENRLYFAWFGRRGGREIQPSIIIGAFKVAGYAFTRHSVA